MVRRCYVCKRWDYKNPHLTFYSIPKDALIRRNWMDSLGMICLAKPPKIKEVCSDHFNSTDFELTIFGKKRLKKYALPSFYPKVENRQQFEAVIEHNRLPQVKSELDIIDEEVEDNECIVPPVARIKKEFAYTNDGVVENTPILSPTARIKEECADIDGGVAENTPILSPTARIKEECADIDGEVAENTSILSPIARMKEEFADIDDDRNDDVEHLDENESERVSPESGNSTISAPDTRVIEEYLPVPKSEQTTGGQFSDPTTDSCYPRLPKQGVQQNMRSKGQEYIRHSAESDDTFSDGSSYGSVNSKPKKKQRISYSRLKKKIKQNMRSDRREVIHHSSESDDSFSDGSSYGSENTKPKKRQRIRNDALDIEYLVKNESERVSAESGNSTMSAPGTRVSEEYLPVHTSEQTTGEQFSDPTSDSRNDALDIEHLVKNESERVSPESGNSTMSAPDTRVSEEYLPVHTSEQTTGEQFSDPTIDSYHLKLPKESESESNETFSDGSEEFADNDHNYHLRLPKESESESDDRFSDGSRYGSENRKPKKRKRPSYDGNHNEDLADSRNFEDVSLSTVIRQKNRIKQLENKLQELNTEYDSLSLELQEFLYKHAVSNDVLEAAMQECGMKITRIDFSKCLTRRKDQ